LNCNKIISKGYKKETFPVKAKGNKTDSSGIPTIIEKVAA
jgi:hypothetical protein